ncbi:hypothetical protein F5146DRAFT_199523 [Armillaria mellea]|nr:hypothetical protein F5146DRAFT_199523 [Armillaria mellea]
MRTCSCYDWPVRIRKLGPLSRSQAAIQPREMFSSIRTLDISITLVGLIFTWHLFRRTRRSTAIFPPGPRGLPLIGNLLDMPSQKEWLTFTKWGREIRRDRICFHPWAEDSRGKLCSDGNNTTGQEKFHFLGQATYCDGW